MKRRLKRLGRYASLLRYVTLFSFSAVFLSLSLYGVSIATTPSTQVAYVRGATVDNTPVATTTPPVATTSPYVLHISTPTTVKAIYMSQCVVGTPSLRDKLVSLVDTTELNALVVDIKDFSGGISFTTNSPELAPYVSKKCGATDMREFIQALHLKGIYVIGRITVFQDPFHASIHPDWAVQSKRGGVWKNYGGLAFIDVGARPFWDYIVTLARVAHDDIGFDEINFDYIRFPSDGPLSQALFTHDAGKSKSQALEEFFSYLHGKMSESHIPASADVFGLVSSSADDLGIGQVLEQTMPYFDYISPMVYPSHYNTGFNGYTDVNKHPYEIVHTEMVRAVQRAEATSSPYALLTNSHAVLLGTTTLPLFTKDVYTAGKIRPWLQSFDYPVVYTPAMVEDQIRAAADAGVNSYIFWDAGNKYRSLRAALGQ